MKNVLTVLEYGGAAGQDILRGSIFKPCFDEHNIKVDYAGRYPPGLRRLRSSQSGWVQEFATSLEFKVAMTLYEKIGAWLNDKKIISRSKQYDVIHLIKVSSLDLIKKLRATTSARLVYDIGDAVWLPFYQNKYKDIDRILSYVDAVTCDNRYGLKYAQKFNKEIYIWPTISQVEKFDLARSNSKPSLSSGVITIGWVGGPDTAYNLYKIWEALEYLSNKYSHINFRLVGVGKNYLAIPQFEDVRFSVLPGYTPDVMIKEVLDMDIGLFPMFDTVNSSVRGVLKALVYMSGEAVVVGSPRGDMAGLIRDGVNGYLADTNQEWIEKLSNLIESTELRKQFAKEGLNTVRSDFTIQKSFDCLKQALKL